MFCDVNYVIRTTFTVISSRFYQRKYSLNAVTTIYGICTFQDCDVFFKAIRIARIIRELDFARYHFYDRTGIYDRSREVGIRSLQGSTLTVSFDIVPLFVPYKINTKLVYWDERSLFLEHEVITLHDGKMRCLVVSRQFALPITNNSSKETTVNLLKYLPGSSRTPQCPQYIKEWLLSMKINSEKLKKMSI
ncbi:unnamed protein product, partial [Brenthis ino]